MVFSTQKLLDKNANTRLGSPSSPHGEIIESGFFHEIDWKKLERRQLESPFKPEIVSEYSRKKETFSWCDTNGKKSACDFFLFTLHSFVCLAAYFWPVYCVLQFLTKMVSFFSLSNILTVEFAETSARHTLFRSSVHQRKGSMAND